MNKIEMRMKHNAQVNHIKKVVHKAQHGDQHAKALIDGKIQQQMKNSWSDLKSMYAKNVEMMKVVAGVLLMLQNKELMEEVAKQANMTDFMAAMRLLSRDYAAIGKELEQIGLAHLHRDGDSTDLADIGTMFEIVELYQMWGLRYDSLIRPSTNMLLDDLGRAEVTLAQRKAAEAAAATVTETNQAEQPSVDVKSE